MKTFITYPVKIITHLVKIITHLVHIIGDIRGKTCLQAGTEDHNHHHGDQEGDVVLVTVMIIRVGSDYGDADVTMILVIVNI